MGKGGAGFPTARKAAAVAALAAGRRAKRPVVVANVMEGEPASHKDRVLAATAPHLLLDGAVAMAGAIGARLVTICVSATDGREAGSALEAAVAERRAVGLDPVELRLERVPGGYVAGEESALAAWLDRRGGRPTFRPSRLDVPHVDGSPALVDNAETLAHVALIARFGAAWYREAGGADAPGTALVTVSGAVAGPGVREVELGTPLSALLHTAGSCEDTAGVLLGGYGGNWIGPQHLDVPLSPAALATIGASIGSGVVIALGPRHCGLAETARIAAWMAGQSAGQCGPCAFGLPAVAADLAELSAGRDASRALGRLRDHVAQVAGRGACRHPDLVVRLVESALRVFADDVAHHVQAGAPCRGAGLPSVLTLPERPTPLKPAPAPAPTPIRCDGAPPGR